MKTTIFTFFAALLLAAFAPQAQAQSVRDIRDTIRDVEGVVRDASRIARETAELTQRAKQFLPVSANVEIVNAMVSDGEVLLKVYKGASRNPQAQVIAPGESAQFELPKSVFSSRAEPSIVVQGYLLSNGEERFIGASTLKVGPRRSSFRAGGFYVRELPSRQFAQNRVFVVESLGTPQELYVSGGAATESAGCGAWRTRWGLCQ